MLSYVIICYMLLYVIFCYYMLLYYVLYYMLLYYMLLYYVLYYVLLYILCIIILYYIIHIISIAKEASQEGPAKKRAKKDEAHLQEACQEEPDSEDEFNLWIDRVLESFNEAE